MGLRFRKSFKLAPGVRLNFGKKSFGVSVGGKGMRHTIISTGKHTSTIGIPGSGLSYSYTHGASKKRNTKQGGNMKKQNSQTTCKKCGAVLSSNAKVCRYCRTKVKKPVYKKWWVWVLVIALLGSCVSKNEEPVEQNNNFVDSSDTVISDNTTIEQNEPVEVPMIVEPEEDQTIVEPEEPEETEPPIDETPVENQPVVEEIPEVIPTVEETPVYEEPVHEEPVYEETPVYEEPVYEEPIDVTVYTTNTGSKYHRDGCRFLNESQIPKTLSDAKTMGYEPCGVCKP